MKDKSIFIKNIYYMLSYAFKILNEKEYENIASENFENIHNLFAAILSKGIARQLKQGLHKEYVAQRDDIPGLHGKIDLAGSIRNRMNKKRLLSCQFDELSENNLLNQILKTTVFLLLAHPDVEPKYKEELRKEMMFFSGIDLLDPGKIRWSSIQYQRNNASYQMLISLCQFILQGMLLTTEKGEYRLASFLDEQRMSALYEKFILEYYIKECPQIKASASKIRWALDEDFENDVEILPDMQSDITLSKGNKILIIDAKYYRHNMQKRFNKKALISPNLYQIFTYVKNKEAEFKDREHEVSGLLLYASTEDEFQPDHSFKVSGNKFSAKTLDLNQDFSRISSQLNAIAAQYFN